MRRLVATEFVSLEGVFEEPQEWTFPFFDEDVGKYKFEETFSSGAQLLGRVTYEAFASSWPARTGDFADRFNSMPKYVVSRTLHEADWTNSHLIKGDLSEEVARLKEASGNDIVVHGSGQLVDTLMRENLLDELRLMVFPVVLGHGRRLFREGGPRKTLRLADSRVFESGVILLTYQLGELATE